MNYKYSSYSVFLAITMVLCSCASNSYRLSYASNDIPSELWNRSMDKPILVEITDFSQVAEWEAEGYCVLGQSIFNGNWLSRAWAMDFAKEIGASHILVHFKNTELKEQQTTVYVPIATPTYHYGYVYTPHGSARYSGTDITTSVVPVTSSEIVAKWEQTAIFLAKLKQIPSYGVEFDTPPNIPGQKDGEVKVRVVYRGSSAEKQGILVGDVLLRINGVDIPNHAALDKFFKTNSNIERIETKHEK